MASRSEVRENKVKIINEFYKKFNRTPKANNVNDDLELLKLKSNIEQYDSQKMYSFIKDLPRGEGNDIKGLEDVFALESVKILSFVSEKYSKEIKEEKKIETLNGKSHLARMLDKLFQSNRGRKSLEKALGFDTQELEKLFNAIGYDHSKFSSLFEPNIKEVKNDISKLELISDMSLKTLDDVSNLKLTNIEIFLKDLFQFEKTEINGWFLEVIKNDFNEVKDIIKDVNSNSRITDEDKVVNIRLGIFNLINQRGVKVKNNELVKPFANFDDMHKYVDMDFNKAGRGMPDVIYFPKDKEKNIVSSNVTSWETKDKEFSVYHHFYKIAKLDSITSGFSKNANIIDTIGQRETYKTDIDKLIKLNKAETYNNLKEELKTKSLDSILNIDKISFTAILEGTSLSVYNQLKAYNKEGSETIPIADLKEVEEINTIILLLSITNNENSNFVSKSGIYNSDIREIDNKIIENMLEKINVGILSKNYGFYTETSNNNIESSIDILLDYILENETKFEKLNLIQSKNDYADVFKDYVANAINYIGTYYPEKLLDRKDKILENKVFSNAVNDLTNIVNRALDKEQITVLKTASEIDGKERGIINNLVKSGETNKIGEVMAIFDDIRGNNKILDGINFKSPREKELATREVEKATSKLNEKLEEIISTSRIELDIDLNN